MFYNNSYIASIFITIVMIIDSTPLKVLTHFFDDPYQETYLRELARRINLSIYSTKIAADHLVLEGLLLERREGRLRYLKANTGNLFFKQLKIAFNVKKILDSRLTEHLIETIPATSSIILYGSWAKGENDYKSDIDILVIGQRPNRIDASGLETSLGHGIELTVHRWSEWRKKAETDKAFYIEIITSGIALHGYLPVVE